MILLWMGSMSWAEPAPRETDGVLPRASERPEPGWFARLDDLGGPVSPRWSRRDRSTYRVWQFADGRVERVWVRSQGEVTEELWFDQLGWPTQTVEWRDEVPVQATAHLTTPVTIKLEGWVAHEVAGGLMWWPEAPVNGEQTVLGGRLRVWTEAKEDVMSPAYVERWLKDCGCELVERIPVWIDGEPAVRMRFHTFAIGAADAAYLWALPREEGTWLASYSVREALDPDVALAPGQLALRLVRWPVED